MLGDITNTRIYLTVFTNNSPKGENDTHLFHKYIEKGCRIRTD